jgi:exodeoxyribonuclease-3
MRIATWNVNGIRARLEYVRLWLRDRRPDVVGLQELKSLEEKFPYAELEEEGYRALVHGQKAWNGVAVLTRKEAAVAQTGLPGQEDFGARLIGVDVEGLRFTTVYVPNGKQVQHDDFPRKLAWLEGLASHLREHDATVGDAVLCGDFNICPEAVDSWDEERFEGTIFHTDEERSRYRALLDCGYVDLYRKAFPDKQEFTWWDYRGGSFHRGHGLRIDFLLATQGVAARLRAVEIDRDFRKKIGEVKPSDHAPVIADLD